LATARFLAYLLHRRPTIAHFFLPEPYLLGAPSALLARIPIRILGACKRDCGFPLARGLAPSS